MIRRALKNEALQFSLSRFFHVGRGWRHKFLKQNMSKLQQLTQAQDRQGSLLLIDKIEQSIQKASSEIYLPFLHNKMLVEYHFRQYGRVEMTLLNFIEYCKYLKLPSHYKLQQLVRLTLLHLFYQHQKLLKVREEVQANIQHLSREAKWDVFYMLSLAKMHDKRDAIENTLISLTDLLNDQQFSDISFKYRTMVAILTLKVIAQRDNHSDYSTLKIYKKFINNAELKSEEIMNINAQKMVDYLVSHDQNSQLSIIEVPRQKLNPELINLVYVIAQRKIMTKNFKGAEDLISKLPYGSLKVAFLENTIKIEKQRFRQSEFAMNNLIQHTNLPVTPSFIQEEDAIKYELLKMLELCYGKLGDKYNQQKMECDSETFCLVNEYDKIARKVYFFNLPFNKYFSLDKFRS